jgi:Mor family transcriptional regulator
MTNAKKDRNEAIYRDWLAGISRTSLAESHKISRERIKQIIDRCERVAKFAARQREKSDG